MKLNLRISDFQPLNLNLGIWDLEFNFRRFQLLYNAHFQSKLN
jgi:hypothetical protein